MDVDLRRAIIADLLEEEELGDEVIFAAIEAAHVAVTQLMEMEDGLDAASAHLWVPIQVNIEDYLMPDPCFSMHFRMDRHTFEELRKAVEAHLRSQGRLQRIRTPLRHILLMALWILATPDSFRSVALRFGVRPSTLYYHYTTIIEALREMAPNYIKWPYQQERARISHTFQMASGMPGVVGAIDCTHVYITKPSEDAAEYRNRHHSYSLTVQAVVDDKLLVRDLYVGEPGSRHDSRTFRRSPLYVGLLENHLHHQINPNEHLVGDGAYAVTCFLLAPFSNNRHRTILERNFNKRLSQCRVRVENAFGRAKGKWRRLKFLHCYNHRNAMDHIIASFVLHNFTVLHGMPLITEEQLAVPLQDPFADVGDADAENEEIVGPEHPLLANARLQGHEKRQFIVHHIIPNLE